MKTGLLNTLGTLNAGEFQLIYDNEISSAVTSVTISGLDGDTDVEYKLIIRAVSGSSTGHQWYLRPNNDSGANYSRQDIYGSSTTLTSERITSDTVLRTGFLLSLGAIGLIEHLIYAKSGYIRTVITKDAEDISGTTVGNIFLRGQVWNNTADNITSLVISSSVTNGIGVGSHILLFARRKLGSEATSGLRTGLLEVKGKLNAGVMQKIYENTLASAATSVTISGLDGDTDILYKLVVRSVSGATDSTTQLRINNDSTAAIYGWQSIDGQSTTIIAARGTDSKMYLDENNTASGSLVFATMLLYAKTGYVRTSIGDYTANISGTTVTSIGLHGQSYNETSTNITSLVILSDVTNGLGIGTRIELWALRKK